MLTTQQKSVREIFRKKFFNFSRQYTLLSEYTVSDESEPVDSTHLPVYFCLIKEDAISADGSYTLNRGT